jgi:hypothetical protein
MIGETEGEGEAEGKAEGKADRRQMEVVNVGKERRGKVKEVEEEY